MKQIVPFCLLLLLGACAGSGTQDIPSVSGLDVPRYMGKWYEIARLPHTFEKDLDFVTAEYTLRDDGRIRVVNQGMRNGAQSRAEGIAKLKNPDARPVTGDLRVSFFRPFYGDYRIIELGNDYSYAVVTSSSKDYLWILSRSPQLPEKLLSGLTARLKTLGFDTEKLEYPKQEVPPCSGAKSL